MLNPQKFFCKKIVLAYPQKFLKINPPYSRYARESTVCEKSKGFVVLMVLLTTTIKIIGTVLVVYLQLHISNNKLIF